MKKFYFFILVIIFCLSIFILTRSNYAGQVNCKAKYSSCISDAKKLGDDSQKRAAMDQCKKNDSKCKCENKCSTTYDTCTKKANRSKMISRKNRLKAKYDKEVKACRSKC